jgi:4-carboxymuconolactone decarboxylase
MIAPAGPRRYRIILHGACGELLRSALSHLTVESGRGWTTIVATVRDESELYGLLDRFEDFALHVVSLSELGADVLRPLDAGRPPTSFGRPIAADWLRGAAAGDAAILESAFGAPAENIEQSGLDMRVHALVRLAALVAAGEPGTVYTEHIATALNHGVTLDEIVGVLVALLPTVGSVCVTAASAAILEGIGRVAPDIPAVDPAKQD